MSTRFAAPSILLLLLAGACSDVGLTAPVADPPTEADPVLATCTVSVRSPGLRCGVPTPGPAGLSRDVMGGQDIFVHLASSYPRYSSKDSVFAVMVTVQSLIGVPIGTWNGVDPDPEGIRVFFNTGPVATVGSGLVQVLNPDGVESYTAAGQP